MARSTRIPMLVCKLAWLLVVVTAAFSPTRAQLAPDKPIRMLVAIAAGDLARWTRIIADAGIKQE